MTLHSWTVVIPGAPVAWGRAGIDFARRRVFTAARSAAWKALAVSEVSSDSKRPRRLCCPVSVGIVAVFERPARLKTKARAETHAWHVAKPDADNLMKACCDALQNAGVVADDCVAYDVRVVKRYALGDEQPHVFIRVTWEGE